MRAERGRGNAGLTLIEVLVALGILASALIAVVALFGVGGRGFRSGRSMTQAVAIAESVLEEVNGLLTPIGGGARPPTFSSAEGLRVLVRVGWWEGSRERSVELVTVRF